MTLKFLGLSEEWNKIKEILQIADRVWRKITTTVTFGWWMVILFCVSLLKKRMS